MKVNWWKKKEVKYSNKTKERAERKEGKKKELHRTEGEEKPKMESRKKSKRKRKLKMERRLNFFFFRLRSFERFQLFGKKKVVDEEIDA